MTEKENFQEALNYIIDNFQSEDEPSAISSIIGAIDMPDEQFALVYEHLLSEYDRSLNDPTSCLFLVQALNANGTTVEEFNESFDDILITIDEAYQGKINQMKVDYLKRIMAMLIKAVNNTAGVSKKIVPVPFELATDAVLPVYAHVGDAGMDVYAIEDTVIGPGETKLVRTGLKCAIPSGYEIQVRPRSGLSLKTPLRVANAPGTIDAGYRDEIGVIVTNTEPKIKDVIVDDANGVVKGVLYGSSYTITKGMKFAQLVLKEFVSCAPYEVEEIGHDNDRGGGFGSTGVR